jgi:hypothetical protein
MDNRTMLRLIEMHRSAIAELCRRFHVHQLEVFGSAARGSDFDPANSDVDLLITYLPGHQPGIAAHQNLPTLRTQIEALLAELGASVAEKVLRRRWRLTAIDHPAEGGSQSAGGSSPN